MHTETKSECVQRPTQHINPVFVFELSIVLLCSERWLGRFGVLNASVCLRVLKPPSQRCQSSQPVSNGPNSESWFFSQSICTIISGALTSWSGLEGHLCSIYCVSIWFQPRGQSHSFCQQRRRAQEVLELIYSLLSGWAGSQLTNTPHICPPQKWLSSNPAVKYYWVYTFLSL